MNETEEDIVNEYNFPVTDTLERIIVDKFNIDMAAMDRKSCVVKGSYIDIEQGEIKMILIDKFKCSKYRINPNALRETKIAFDNYVLESKEELICHYFS